MSWLTIFRLTLVWYVVVQLITVAVLPLTLRVLRGLPDRGYALAKISGILLVGTGFWLLFSYGLLRNERGGAWMALFLVGAMSWLAGWTCVVAWWQGLRQKGQLRSLIVTEAIFLVAFAGWVLVRAYDPNVDHTEQPMDMMFMNSIWASATYPPQDAWLAGYAISYYYLGYWLLTTLARLANTSPSIAYNLGQAVWYGLLWTGAFGVVMNLLAWRGSHEANTPAKVSPHVPISGLSLMGGVLGGMCVALTGNLQVILEWLYAQGVNINALARWIDVPDFPANASQSGLWYIDFGWWWWRSSRVINDLDLLGRHIEISPIDEFPMFSYLLGDNHPHVLAMPVALFVVALGFNLLLLLTQARPEPDVLVAGNWSWLPLRALDSAVYVLALGSLLFLNTWDFPPYWLLLVAVVLLATGGNWRRALTVGGALLGLAIALYIPYFFTAQSQAGGIIPNVFNPTRLPQFLVMFGGLLPALIGVIAMGWRLARPAWQTLGWVALLVIGAPCVLLALSAALSSTTWGERTLARMELPPDASSYAQMIAQRWLAEPWTLLLAGVLLMLLLGVIFTLLHQPPGHWSASADVVFVMLLGAIGLALVYAPEFIFLRDNFGSRMNTVFKFYYQGWLLLGLSAAYLIAVALSGLRRTFGIVQVAGLVSLVLVLACLLFPVAGIYAKTGGFAREAPTLDATEYVAQSAPDVMAAVQWVREHTTPDQIVLEGEGNSYAARDNRISWMTGRATLLGWSGHESQWRGDAFGRMAEGRTAAIESIYRTARPAEINAILEQWGITYIFVGPSEIEKYGITSIRLDELSGALDTVFSRGQVRIFRRRES